MNIYRLPCIITIEYKNIVLFATSVFLESYIALSVLLLVVIMIVIFHKVVVSWVMFLTRPKRSKIRDGLYIDHEEKTSANKIYDEEKTMDKTQVRNVKPEFVVYFVDGTGCSRERKERQEWTQELISNALSNKESLNIKYRCNKTTSAWKTIGKTYFSLAFIAIYYYNKHIVKTLY